MRRISVFLVLTAALLAPALHAQTPEPQTAPTAQACPPTATLDQLITAIDDAVSGPANKDRTCFRELFLPDARLIPIRIDAVAKRGSAVFYEKQIKVRTESWAHIAHLWSTYETRTTPDGKPPDGKVLDRGINSIQAVFDGKKWQVLEITWQAETPANPVPAKYLP